MECPHCHKDMGTMTHGECAHCKKMCGCSWDPTSMNDYCMFHRPGSKTKESRAFQHANLIANRVEELIESRNDSMNDVHRAVVDAVLEQEK
jgi:hypothetical protein